MNQLDENFPQDQQPLLQQWRIPYRRIGLEVAQAGIKDGHIIPLLHRLRHVTFFTQDEDFYERNLCHQAYCLVWLDVKADDAAAYVRRFLRHPAFDTKAKRMAVVARAYSKGVQYWHARKRGMTSVRWDGD